MPASDATLVSGVLNGDRAAFAELYDRRARLIRAVCFDATHDLDVAADLTQETFLRAWMRLRALREPQRFAPWLVGIARQVCREWRRGKLRYERRLAGLAATRRPATAGDAAQPPDPPRDERLDLLRDALAALPERERLGLHAFYLQDLDAEQARTVLGLSRSGLYRLLACARRRLRSVLEKQEVRS
ncbi:MAG: sigma-70 family RNA polymerase sigma factor [Planctomycetota bacterium]